MAVKNELLKQPTGFLATAWPQLASEAPGDPITSAAAITAPFQLWGLPVPADIAALLRVERPPQLMDLTIGSYAPLPSATGNSAEARIMAAQDYVPLWCELFAATVEVGSSSSGDIWMYAVPIEAKATAPMHLYAHDADQLGLAETASIEALVYGAALQAASKHSAIDPETYREGLDALQKLEPQSQATYTLMERSRWLVTLLSTIDASDAEIRRAFVARAAPGMSEGEIAGRAARFVDFAPTAFYFGFAAFFVGDDARLQQVITLAAESKIPIVRDLVVLLKELRDGRKALGKVADMQALRQRVMALRLLEPRNREAPLSPERAAMVDRAARDGGLEGLAYASIDHPASMAAIEKAWAGDAAMADTVAMLGSLFGSDGYRNEAVIARFVVEANRQVQPILLSHAVIQTPKLGLLALEILAEWADERVVPALAPIARVINRFHLERVSIVRLLHNVAASTHAPLLASIIRENPPKSDDSARNEMLANAVLALADLEGPLRDVEAFAAGTINSLGRECAIGLADAARYAVTERGGDVAGFVDEVVAKRGYNSPGTCWALARASAKDATRARETLEAGRGSLDSLLDENLGNQQQAIARAIASEHALVALGADVAPLKRLVTTVLENWPRVSDGAWRGYEGHGVLVWALLALRKHPEIGTHLATPYLTSRVPQARTLARHILKSLDA